MHEQVQLINSILLLAKQKSSQFDLLSQVKRQTLGLDSRLAPVRFPMS